MSVLDAIVVGCGYAGEQHALGFQRAPASRLVAVCDLDETRAHALASSVGVPAFGSLDDALASTKPEIVSVATDEYHHDEIAIRALASGAHVFCEKMMAHSLDAGEQMVLAARRAARTLAVNFNYRHVPGYRTIRDSIQGGELKSPSLVAMNVHAYLWHHAIDLLRFFLGDPVSVQASLQEDEQLRRNTYHWQDHERLLYVPSESASAIFRYDSGTIASLSGSARVPFADHWISFAIYSPGGALHIDHGVAASLIGAIGPGPLRDRLQRLPSFSVEDSFQASILAFVEAVSKRRPPLATSEDGLVAMQIEAAVARAARAGSEVRIEV